LANRLRRVQFAAGQQLDDGESAGPLFVLRIVAAVGNAVARSGLLSTRTIAELEHTLTAAGFRGGRGLGLFVGSKVLMLVGLSAISFVAVQQVTLPPIVRIVLVPGAAIIGLIGPDQAVHRVRQKHLRLLERGLPDALDLLQICTEAGLSLGPALARVSSEIRPSNTAVADELGQTASELQVTSDTRAALIYAGTRTGLEGMKRLSYTLTQSIQYGTPISQTLRTLSVEMRQEMLNRFEAQAARLPVVLTVPMIVFILPCVFLIVGGPAILQLMDILYK
jgi:tight adherence protein C